MAKGKNEPSDYLEQLQWQAEHRRRLPVWFEPKWKYKIVYRFAQESRFGKVSQFLIFVGVLFMIAKFASLEILRDNPIATIIIGGILASMVIIIFFAIRDASKDDDSKHIDS